ncbi:MAG: ATP-binding protein [Fidelibacterota bacterium]
MTQRKTPLTLQSVFDHLTDFIVVCRPDYTIVESNKSADVILGKGESLVGKTCHETFRNRPQPCADCPLSATMESGTVIPLNTYDQRFEEYFEERTHPVVSKGGELEGFVLTGRNVTRIREIEDKFAQAKKLAAIGRVSSGVAHDFSNILTGVLGRVQMLKEKLKDSPLLDLVKVIEKAARNGVETVRRIQDFTRARGDVPLEPVDLGGVITDVISLTRPRWEKGVGKGRIIEVVPELQGDLTVLGNRSGLDNAFTNIIFNAVDAMPDGGVLSIHGERKGNRAVIRFRDTGIGMTEETRERVFDPFFTTRAPEGTGLGMSEVYGVVKRHDGRIHVKSEVGKGTEITVTFPLSEAGPAEKAPEEPYEAVPGRILVIDDEEYVLHVVEDVLVESGHQVTGFTSAGEGLDQFKKGRFDVVITDLLMPEMSGRKVAEKIKTVDKRVPVVLLSGWTLDPEEQKKVDRVVDFSISKPFSAESIRQVVSRAMQQSRLGKR